MSGVAWWRSALWRRAPLVLLRHRSALVAVMAAGFLVALAASSAPLVTTAAASSALKTRLVSLSPLATGLEVSAPFDAAGQGTLAGWASERSAAARTLAARLRLERPVLTEESSAIPLLNGNGDTQVVLMARTGVLGHVKVLQQVSGTGVWVSDLTAQSARVRPGGELRLEHSGINGTATRSVRLRVKGIYRALDRSSPGPYWANFQPEIFPPGPDPGPPNRYVFMSPGALYATVNALSVTRTFHVKGQTFHFRSGPQLEAITEMSVDPAGLTLSQARTLVGRFAALPMLLRDSALGRGLGCAAPASLRVPASQQRLLCSLSSSLSAAVTLANRNANEISPVVWLLSGAGIAVALGVAGAAGLFLVRRRTGEAALLFARGEHVGAFAARTGVELLLPTLAGAAAGFGLALGLTGIFAPAGAVDGGTVAHAAEHGAEAAAGGFALALVVASLLFARQFDAGRRRFGWVWRLPWEVPVAAVAGWLVYEVVSGGGLAGGNAGGAAHLTLPVFAVPLLLVAAAAGVTARALRGMLRRSPRMGGDRSAAVFFALRRLAAARGVLVALLVVSAVSFGAYLYAESLAASLTHSVTEKSYVAYGGDAQGLLGEVGPLPPRFPYPATELAYANQSATLGGPDGTQADLLAIDPATLGSVIRWYPDWGPDPRPLLPRLRSPAAGPLPVIATRAVPAGLHAIWVQGVRLPVKLVTRVAAFPGMDAGVPLLVVDRATLENAAQRAHLANPLGVPQVYVWAKGPPAEAARALEAAPLHAYFVTTIRQFTSDPEVVLAGRMFGYMRLIAIAAGVLVLAGLLLYLQARQRSQAVSSALAARMGLPRRAEVLSLALELGAIGLLAALVGGVVALSAAAPIVAHTDPLPDSPPPPAAVIPAVSIAAVVLALVLIAAAAAVTVSWSARRTDMSEALRVV